MTFQQVLEQLNQLKKIPIDEKGLFIPSVELMTTILMSLPYWPSTDDNENVVDWFPRKDTCGVDLYCVERDKKLRWEASWNRNFETPECVRYGGSPQEAIYNLSMSMLRLFDLRVFLTLDHTKNLIEILNYPSDGSYEWGKPCGMFSEDELLFIENYNSDFEVYVSVKNWKYYGRSLIPLDLETPSEKTNLSVVMVQGPKIIKL